MERSLLVLKRRQQAPTKLRFPSTAGRCHAPLGGTSPPCSRRCCLGTVRRVGCAVSVTDRRPADETVFCASSGVRQQAGPSRGKPATSHQRYAQPTQGMRRVIPEVFHSLLPGVFKSLQVLWCVVKGHPSFKISSIFPMLIIPIPTSTSPLS